jgi:hypothetical protein
MDLDDLQKRVNEATGYSDELNAAVCDAVGFPPRLTGPVNPGVGPVKIYPNVAGSVDAALALAERVLPEWRPEVKNVRVSEMRAWCVTLRWWEKSAAAWGATAPLAILSATLSAFRTQSWTAPENPS